MSENTRDIPPITITFTSANFMTRQRGVEFAHPTSLSGYNSSMSIHLALDAARVAEFCRVNHIRRLALFGSVLRDDFRADSDVDVLAEFAPGHTPGLRFFALQDELSAIMGRRADLNTPGFLGRRMREGILREAETLYAKD